MDVTITEEHRERARQEARELLAAVLADKPAPEPRRRTTISKPRPEKVSPNAKGGATAKVSRAEVQRLFVDEGLGVMEISRRLGVHRKTVSQALTDVGIERPVNQRAERCKNGHDMKETWRPNRNGRAGGYCIECRRKWDREDKKSKYVPVAERV